MKYSRTWREATLCVITRNSTSGLTGTIWLRSVSGVGNSLGPEFPIDIGRDVVRRQDVAFLPPAQTELAVAELAIKVYEEQQRQAASARSTPYWDPY